MQCRKGQAWGAFWKLEKIWRSKTIKIETKVRIFQAAVISILLYGSETWVITNQQMKSLDSFATNCYRVMLSIRRSDHITNEEVYNRVGQQELSFTIIKRQLTWLGHMLRRKPVEPIRRYALFQPSEGMIKILGSNQKKVRKPTI